MEKELEDTTEELEAEIESLTKNLKTAQAAAPAAAPPPPPAAAAAAGGASSSAALAAVQTQYEEAVETITMIMEERDTAQERVAELEAVLASGSGATPAAAADAAASKAAAKKEAAAIEAAAKEEVAAAEEAAAKKIASAEAAALAKVAAAEQAVAEAAAATAKAEANAAASAAAAAQASKEKEQAEADAAAAIAAAAAAATAGATATPAPAPAPAGAVIFAEVEKRLTAEHVAGIGGIFHLTVSKDGAPACEWTLNMATGTGAVRQGGPIDGETADTTIALEETTLVEWLEQKINPVEAFMSGLLTVSGDQMMVMKLGVLQPVFREAAAHVAAAGGSAGAAPAEPSPSPAAAAAATEAAASTTSTTPPTAGAIAAEDDSAAPASGLSDAKRLEFQTLRAARFRKVAERMSESKEIELQEKESNAVLVRLADMLECADEQYLTYLAVKNALIAEFGRFDYQQQDVEVKSILQKHAERLDAQNGAADASGSKARPDSPAKDAGTGSVDDAEPGAGSGAGAGDGTSPQLIFAEIESRMTEEHVQKVGGVFRFDITQGKYGQVVKQWTLDLKSGATGKVYPGPPKDELEADAILTLSESALTRWLNQKLDPIYAFMTGKLKIVGDQKMVIKLNVIKPLFKEACAAAKAPPPAVSTEAAHDRAAIEAEWAQYQAEEQHRAETVAQQLEQEAEERRKAKAAEAEAARARSRVEAEEFAKAAADEIGWGTDEESVRKRRESIAKMEADKVGHDLGVLKDAESKAAAKSAQLAKVLADDVDDDEGDDLFGKAKAKASKASTSPKAKDLDELFAEADAEHAEREAKEREEQHLVEQAALEKAAREKRQAEEKVRKEAEKEAKRKAEWAQIQLDTEKAAAELAAKKADEAANAPVVQPDLKDEYGFSVAGDSIFDPRDGGTGPTPASPTRRGRAKRGKGNKSKSNSKVAALSVFDDDGDDFMSVGSKPASTSARASRASSLGDDAGDGDVDGDGDGNGDGDGDSDNGNASGGGRSGGAGGTAHPDALFDGIEDKEPVPTMPKPAFDDDESDAEEQEAAATAALVEDESGPEDELFKGPEPEPEPEESYQPKETKREERRRKNREKAGKVSADSIFGDDGDDGGFF